MTYLDRLYLQQREMHSKVQIPYITRSISSYGDLGDLITVITGPRRAGKSTAALCQIIKGLPAAYINFDDKELGCDTLILITESEERESEAEWYGIKRKIHVVPLYKILLGMTSVVSQVA